MKLLKNAYVIVAGLGLFTMIACNNENSANTEVAKDSLSTPEKLVADSDSVAAAIATKVNTDQDFVNYIVPKNTKELIWLQAGISRGSSKELKNHAKMMIVDHKKLDAAVKKIIAEKNYTNPQVDTANVVDIGAAAGKDWDIAWTNKMVDEHSDLLSNLQKSQAEVKDSALLKMISSTIPVVQKHLDMVKMMQGKIK